MNSKINYKKFVDDDDDISDSFRSPLPEELQDKDDKQRSFKEKYSKFLKTKKSDPKP